MKILNLIIYSWNVPEYTEMYNLLSNYLKKINIEYYFIIFREDIKETIILNNDIICFKGKESLVPGILEKTILAFELLKNKNYDYIVRSNISTIINYKLLKKKLSLHENIIFYDGGVKYNSGIFDKKYGGNVVVQKNAIILNKNAVNLILENKHKILNYGIVDDVAFGVFFNKDISEFINFDTKINSKIYENDIIFYRNKHYDRQIDVKNMKNIINNIIKRNNLIDEKYRDFKTNECKNKPDMHTTNTEDLKSYQYKHRISYRYIDEEYIVNADDEPSTGNCIERSKTILRSDQQRVIKYMDNNDSMLVIHGVGLGKTLTSIAVSECFLDKDPDNHTVIICPDGLIAKYKTDMIKYGVKRDHAIRYTFYSYEKFVDMKKTNIPIPCDDNTFLIIDEVHNLRNTDSEQYNAVLECALKAKKRLLLTATPFVNFLTDFIALINLLYGKIITDLDKEYIDYIEKKPTEQNLTKLYYYLDGKIDIRDSSCSNEKFVKVPMSNAYYNRYKIKIGDFDDDFPDKFLNSHRKAVNNAGSLEYITDKLKASIPIIKSGKSFIITNWLKFGISVVKNVLDKENISYELINDKTTSTEKVEIISRFKNDKFDTLIITHAGDERINLNNVKNVIVLDPTWNHASMSQMENVDIHLLVSTPPEGIEGETGDQKLYEIMRKKREINKKVINNLKKYCISSDRMSFSEKKPNEYVENVLKDYNETLNYTMDLINKIPENISISEFAEMIERKDKTRFNNYIKIIKHLLKDEYDLVNKINNIEKRAVIYFKKKGGEEIEIVIESEEEVEITKEVENQYKIKKGNVMNYVRKHRESTKEEQPELSEKEVNYLLLKKWNTLSEEEKIMYK